ncbi:MAG: hypothetical protein BWX80_03282 [Candidatus Hydrogenedentes bacterium ADurb.Bin101]|nr:MAG: hypothetical protein BWX80_03282 [Candidatus Hydrogenedentes bacterium ADurb.Bin101]
MPESATWDDDDPPKMPLTNQSLIEETHPIALSSTPPTIFPIKGMFEKRSFMLDPRFRSQFALNHPLSVSEVSPGTLAQLEDVTPYRIMLPTSPVILLFRSFISS